MKFQSKWSNATYVVLPTTRIIYPGQGSVLVPGLRAEFRGRSRIFDSEAYQRSNRWTDEQRIQVENHLLGHEDWGHGLYLAPGEVLPEDREDAVVNKTPVTMRRCSQISVVKGEVDQCPDEARIGREFCTKHDPEEVKIESGLMHS